MRIDSDALTDLVRSFNRRVLNPVMLHLAGRKYWYAAVLRHVGRRTGRHYATPVVAIPMPNGFIVPLPYGTAVDWLRNVQAAGKAVIIAKGRSYDICDPAIIDSAAASALLPSRGHRVFEIFGIETFLKVRAV